MRRIALNAAGTVRNSGDSPLMVQVIPVEVEGKTLYCFSSWRIRDGAEPPPALPPRTFESLDAVREFFVTEGMVVDWQDKSIPPS